MTYRSIHRENSNLHYMYTRNSPLDHDEDNPLPKCGEGRPVRNLNLPTKRALMPPRLERLERARALDAKLAEIWDLGGRDVRGKAELRHVWPGRPFSILSGLTCNISPGQKDVVEGCVFQKGQLHNRLTTKLHERRRLRWCRICRVLDKRGNRCRE